MDKDRNLTDAGIAAESAEEGKDSTLEWLLDMDMSEPRENLFTVDAGEFVEQGLSQYEVEVAARPLTRGKAGADDYDSYVEEEIVISSETESSDIYASVPDFLDSENGSESPLGVETMAIDFSRDSSPDFQQPAATLSEGLDILGLSNDDDMGEKYLVLKKVKPSAVPENQSSEDASVVAVSPQAETPRAETPQAETPLVETPLVETPQVETPQVETPQVEEPRQELPQEEPHMLTQAPVLRLVDAPDDLTVANEPGVAGESGSPRNLIDYISLVKPPSDEQEFDNYLLNGEQLQSDQFNLEQLLVEHGDGIVPADSSPQQPVDFHEDFLAMPGFGESLVEGITAESTLADQWLGAEQPTAEPTVADQWLGAEQPTAEPTVADQWLGAEQPAAETPIEQPIAKDCLVDDEMPDDLVLEEFAGEEFSGDGFFVEEFAAEDFAVGELAAKDPAPEIEVVTEAPMGELFAADSPDIDLEEEFSRAQKQASTADIEAVFDDLGFMDDSEVSDVGPDSFGSLEANSDFDFIADADAEDELVQDLGSDTPQLQVFEDDIFAGDFLASMDTAQETPAEHIDALFDSLGKETSDQGEICGLDVDEFAVADAPVQESLSDTIAAELEPAASLESDALEAPADSGPDHSWCVPRDVAFSYASKGGGEIFSDFLDAFIEEGSSELEKLEDAIGLWEKDVHNDTPYITVTRILHTIKGIAKGVGLQYYGTLIHNFETLLEALPRPQDEATADYFRIVNVWLDAAVRGLDYVQTSRSDIVSEFPLQAGRTAEATVSEANDEVLAAVEAQPVVAPQGQEQVRSQRVAKQLADDGAKALAAQQTVRITSEKLDHMLNLTNQAQQLGVRTAQSTARGKRTTSEMQSRLASVRAHISGIADRALRTVTARGVQGDSEMDALEMDQYSELQEAANILREGVEDLADLVDFASRQNAQIEALLKQQGGVISSIGSSIRAARVVPVSRLIPGLRRLVRTVSTDLDKRVSLQVLNELGTLDRDDFGRCQTILDHMVRNALDHGIEPAAQREAAGKSGNGQVTIDIRKAGADAIITLADDGRGIDPETMRESALKKGLDIDVDALSDEEAQRLIFHKGFSTAVALSQISGRGVGMDIVLNEIQQMGGDIQIDSVVGRGTSFHIRIPSSVTVNGALLVSAGEQSYAIPLGGLIAVEQVPADEFFGAAETGGTLSLAGMDCEPAYLATLCQGQSLPDRKAWGGSVPVIIAGNESRTMAIAVDDVEEALELVIRSLGVQFSSVPGVAGAATTADGEAIVALDLNLLVASVGEGQVSQVSVSSDPEESLLALVVDDSRTQRMVATSQLETVGVETVTAENGAVAIDLLNSAERLPDIILLDVEMPVKDGIQTLREIRKSVRYSHVPVIMITSRTGLKHRALAQSAGCNGYMGKPFNFRMLIGQINELTGHRLQLS